MKQKLTLSSYLAVGSMLFGMFFGAGNLIFPVHMGQEAGSNVFLANIGFLITGVGLPFLGILAIGISNSNGLHGLASKISPCYATILTILLYITIGPAFALPRTATVSYEIGLSSHIGAEMQTISLALFTFVFFAVAAIFSLNSSKILTWVGKVLNPLFLLFLAFLIFMSFYTPMGEVTAAAVQAPYDGNAFFKGFTEGYNTMDALASLAFGVIVVQTLKDLGLKHPKEIAMGTLKAGFVSVVLMLIIYTCLSYIGASSIGEFALSTNGGIALAQIAAHYFGSLGSVLLAIIVTLACLKTAIGLITACSETFHGLYPKSLSYKGYVYLFTIVGYMVGNIGLTQIITLAIPVLMFLYPLAITLILLAFISPLFSHNRIVYQMTTWFTIAAAIGDALNAVPAGVKGLAIIQDLLGIYQYLPFFSIGMGWVVPSLAGFVVGLIMMVSTKNSMVRSVE